MKCSKLVILSTTLVCAAAASIGIFWHFKQSKKMQYLQAIKNIYFEHQMLISKKMSALKSDFNKNPGLDPDKIISINEILSIMANVDKKIREIAIESGMIDQMIIKTMDDIDKINLACLLQLLELCGKEWFSVSEFGENCDNNAWLIIQHSDLDSQAKFLPILEKLALKRETKLQNWALLYDRVAMKEGRLQKFGTQFVAMESNQLELYKVEDIQNLDKRRVSVGLQPMDTYVKTLESVYKKPCKYKK